VLHSENEILIKNLWECKNIWARMLIKMSHDELEKTNTVNHFLRKLRTTGSVERNPGSRRPWSSRTANKWPCLSHNFVTWNVTHLWRHHVIKYVNCTVFYSCLYGNKKKRNNRSKNARVENDVARFLWPMV